LRRSFRYVLLIYICPFDDVLMLSAFGINYVPLWEVRGFPQSPGTSMYFKGVPPGLRTSSAD
jgi:hypothetical protein